MCNIKNIKYRNDQNQTFGLFPSLGVNLDQRVDHVAVHVDPLDHPAALPDGVVGRYHLVVEVVSLDNFLYLFAVLSVVKHLDIGALLQFFLLHDLVHEAGPHLVLLSAGIQLLRGSRGHGACGLGVGAHMVM